VSPARRQSLRFAWFGIVLLTTPIACVDRALARYQDPSTSIPTAAQIRLERFLSTAALRTDEYFSLFQDLTAEETKTIEIFKGEGEVARSRRIVSDLVVYQAQIDNASIAEYRDVREVDGAPVPGREERVEKMASLRNASASIRDELQRITRESTRYDLERTISGLTITEGLPIQAWARALFAFTVAGSETIEGRTAVVIDYQQTVPNARFGFKFSLPSDLSNAQPLYRGRLWIDAETAYLWRERREIAISAPTPLVIQRTDFDYRPSRFGVPLPSRIVYTSALKFEKGPDKLFRTLPVFRVTFEYGPFKRFTTTADAETLAVAPDTPPAAETVREEPSANLGPEFGPDAPESGLSYEQLAAARRPVQAPPRDTPKPASAPLVASRPPEPKPSPVEPPKAPPIAAPRPLPREIRPPRAIRAFVVVPTAVALPNGFAATPPSSPDSIIPPPPASPPPASPRAPGAPPKQWRPPPS